MGNDQSDRLVYDVNELISLLGISRSSAYEAVRSGQIPSLRIGRRIVIPKTALDAWLANGANTTDRES